MQVNSVWIQNVMVKSEVATDFHMVSYRLYEGLTVEKLGMRGYGVGL